MTSFDSASERAPVAPVLPSFVAPHGASSAHDIRPVSTMFAVLTTPRRVRALLSISAVLTLAACSADSSSATDDTSGAAVATARDTAVISPPMMLGARDVAIASERAVRAGIEVTGSLDPAERVEVRAQIAGQLGRVAVERGTAVRRGQVLTAFESGALRAQVASAEAAVAARTRDLEAVDTLYKRGAASQQDFVNARAARDAAQAQVAQARETLERATVLAPIAGQVSEKLVSSGEAVQTGAKLFTLVNADQLELAGQMAAVDAAQVRVGQRVVLTLEAYPDRELTGRVDRIDPVADPATRQVTAYIRVDNRRNPVVAGLFALGRIQTGTAASANMVVTVPTGAVRTEGADTVVYVVHEGRVQRRVVGLGARDNATGMTEVRRGLQAGERVLTAPGAAPRDGAAVEWLEPAETAKPAEARQPV